MKNTKTIAALLLGTLLFSGCQESLEKRCAREAKTYTEKNCPAKILDNVTVDSMTFDINTHTLSYCYTVAGVLDDSAAVAKTDFRKQMLLMLKNATSLKVYKEAGYRFRYVYHSQKHPGKVIFEAVYTKKDYQ